MSVKSVLDAALGTATTCAFAEPEIGVELAAAFSVGQFLFDLLFPQPKVDPWTQPATRKDLLNAVKAIKSAIDHSLWQDGTNDLMEEIAEARKNLLNAVENAGKPSPTNHSIMGGDTSVWVNGVMNKLFDPISDASDLLGTFAGQRLENHKDNGLTEITAFVDTVSLYLLFCKVGIAWEINQNFKAYAQELIPYEADQAKVKPLQKAWDAYEKAHPGAKHGPRPKGSVPKPLAPQDGDPAEGSQYQAGQGNWQHRSVIGIKHSKFGDYVRDNLPGYIKYAKGLVDKWDKDWTDAIAELEASVTVEAGKTPNDVLQGSNDVVLPKGTPAWRWVVAPNMKAYAGKHSGWWTTNEDLAKAQAEVYRGQLLNTAWPQVLEAKGLTEISRDTLDTLLQIIDTWQIVLNMYNGLHKGIDPKTGKVIT